MSLDDRIRRTQLENFILKYLDDYHSKIIDTAEYMDTEINVVQAYRKAEGKLRAEKKLVENPLYHDIVSRIDKNIIEILNSAHEGRKEGFDISDEIELLVGLIEGISPNLLPSEIKLAPNIIYHLNSNGAYVKYLPDVGIFSSTPTEDGKLHNWVRIDNDPYTLGSFLNSVRLREYKAVEHDSELFQELDKLPYLETIILSNLIALNLAKFSKNNVIDGISFSVIPSEEGVVIDTNQPEIIRDIIIDVLGVQNALEIIDDNRFILPDFHPNDTLTLVASVLLSIATISAVSNQIFSELSEAKPDELGVPKNKDDLIKQFAKILSLFSSSQSGIADQDGNAIPLDIIMPFGLLYGTYDIKPFLASNNNSAIETLLKIIPNPQALNIDANTLKELISSIIKDIPEITVDRENEVVSVDLPPSIQNPEKSFNNKMAISFILSILGVSESDLTMGGKIQISLDKLKQPVNLRDNFLNNPFIVSLFKSFGITQEDVVARIHQDEHATISPQNAQIGFTYSPEHWEAIGAIRELLKNGGGFKDLARASKMTGGNILN